MNEIEDLRPLLEEKIRDLILGRTELNELQVLYRGDPGEFVPRELNPFGFVFMPLRRMATGEEGYAFSTGIEAFVYEGIVAIETLMLDSADLRPDASRRADVPSYRDAQRLGTSALQAVVSWGPNGELSEDPVYSPSRAEKTWQLAVDDVMLGLSERGENNYRNRAEFGFRIFTQRLLQGVWD